MINYDTGQLEIPNVDPDVLFFGGVRESIRQTNGLLERLVADLIRQEIPAPGIFHATVGRNDFPQDVRVRVRNLVVSVSAAATITVRIGSAAYLLFDMGGADVRVLPLPLTIDSGTDVTVTASAGTVRAAYFEGYAEVQRA